MDIRYLVFGGGGAAGCAYAGVLEQLNLESNFSYDNIRAVAGVSSGALAALAVSLKYTPAEAAEKLKALDMQKFEDGGLPVSQWYSLISEYGRSTGNYLYTFINDLIKEKTKRNDPQNVTFADLQKLGFKDLYIVTTKIFKENSVPTGKQKVFSVDTTPHTSVADAIRASVAAPIFFKRLRFKKVEEGKYVLDKDGHLYDDGGLLNNFPIDIFDHPRFLDDKDQENICDTMVNPHTLGFALRHSQHLIESKQKSIKTVIKDWSPFEYAEGVFNSLLFQFEREKLEKPYNKARTVEIDRLGVKLGDFNLDATIKSKLIDAGKEAVKTYFVDHAEELSSGTNHPFGEKRVDGCTFWSNPTNQSKIESPTSEGAPEQSQVEDQVAAATAEPAVVEVQAEAAPPASPTPEVPKSEASSEQNPEAEKRSRCLVM